MRAVILDHDPFDRRSGKLRETRKHEPDSAPASL